MEDQRVTLDIGNGLATLTLVNPDAGNVMDVQLIDALAVAAERLTAAQPRAVLLCAEGKNFCVGGDIRAFAAAPDGGLVLEQMAGRLHEAVLALHALDAPVIAAVQGAAAGAGFSLAIGADIVLAAQSASFSTSYTAIGLSPDGGASYFLPRLIGLRRAQELTFLNRRLNAEEALGWGLITRIVSDAELQAEARAIAEKMAAGPSFAFGAVKQLLGGGSSTSLETHLRGEALRIAASARSGDGREGVAAFIEKRPANFTGK